MAHATRIAIETVRKHPDQIGFAVHPRRWVVERFFAWINRNRWLAKDFEASIASAGGLSLRRFGDAPHPPLGEISMSFEPDSDAVAFPKSPGHSI